ncbi:hypothetical protein RJ639_039296 [Escallonia herrerae]|uniref:Uncharacterized protein n=1 Tax=Escallonia herrerae TaxID=1293975 RepID=A0AA88WK30_9ASTE|nr:hypothetical protein RJ639_039296 [Escallonia herrerae]
MASVRPFLSSTGDVAVVINRLVMLLRARLARGPLTRLTSLATASVNPLNLRLNRETITPQGYQAPKFAQGIGEVSSRFIQEDLKME